MPACGSTTAAPSARTCPRSIRQDAKPETIVRGLGTLYTWNVVSPRLGRHGEAQRRRPDDAAGELRAVQPGRADRRARAVSPGSDADHDDGFRSGDRRLHAHRLGGRSQDATCGSIRTCARRAPTSTRSASIARSAVESPIGDRLRPQGWRRFHRLDRRRRSVSRGDADAGRRPHAAGVRCSSTAPAARRFLLTNPDGYSLTYNGLVTVVEKRRSNGWQAFGSYTLSRASGLQASSGTTAAGAQVSTVALRPVVPDAVTFGRDPNDLTNARGRLPNDRPHMFRVMGSVDVPRTGFVVAANLQIFSGKPWAATAQVSLPQDSSSASCSSRAARAGCRRRRCSTCACRGRFPFGGSGTHRAAPGRAQCAQRHGGGRPGDGQSASARTSVSRPSSWIRAARCSA